MNLIEKIAQVAQVQTALASFKTELPQIVDLTIAIQQIPAPTFAEAERAAFIQNRFKELGLQDVSQDEIHNVYGRFPARQASSTPPLIVSAHSDTVFPAHTDLTVRRDARFIHGPGISDNSTGVAGMLTIAQALTQFNLKPATDIWFVANVGEEGLGNLRGMRAVVQRFGAEAIYIVVEGGLYGQISHQAIGVRRFRIEAQTPGGHSWGSFGNRSAIHELARVITAIDTIKVPAKPKTTYNVGLIEGGTSINTIAQTAHLLLDCRSEDESALAELVQNVKRIVTTANRRKNVTLTITLIGDRPAGQIDREVPLVQWAMAAYHQVGCNEVQFITSSTDANIPLSQGMTAVCVGLSQSHHAHRLDEYMDTTHLPDGIGHLLLLTLAAAGFQDHGAT